MAKQTVRLSKMNYFRLDNVEFKGLIGYKMLKTTNQLNYSVSPGRQTDGSMKNINDYQAFIIPKVEIGFNLIDIQEYWTLRDILMSKRTFQVTYYDNDLGDTITHEMYAEPDDLKDFTNIGADILGVQNFKVAFVGTLNNESLCEANFSGNIVSAPWGRSVIVPDGTWTLDIENPRGSGKYQTLEFKGGDRLTLIQNVSLN